MLFQIAYFPYWEETPEDRVDLCAMAWRIPLYFPFWVAMSLVFWGVGLFALGMMLVGSPFMWLFGNRIAFEGGRSPFSDNAWVPGAKLLYYLDGVNYEVVEIQNRFVRYSGLTIGCSILALVACFLCYGLVMVVAVPSATYLARQAVLVMPWWAWGSAVFVMLACGGPLAYRWFSKTESGKIFEAYLESKRGRYCLVVEIE